MTVPWILLTLALAAPPQEDLADRIDGFVTPYVEAGLWSGSILVARGDSVLVSRGYGWADVEHRVPNDPTTRFPVASVTKAFTRTAAERMALEGRIALDDPLAEYLPEFPRGEEITVAHLLEHRSGIPNTDDLSWFRCGQRFPHRIGELVDSLAAAPLDFDPGTDRSYSNGGYTVLARVLEVAAGARYRDVMRRWVYDPVGMDRSGDLATAGLVRDLAAGYMPGPGGDLVSGPIVHPSNKIGAGSAYTTTGDVLAFFRALRQGTLLSDARVDSALSTVSSAIGPPRIYLGGRAPSYTSGIQLFPTEDVLIVALGNNYARLNEEITDGIAGLVFGRWEDPRVEEILNRSIPSRGAAADVPVARLRALAGRYRHQWGFTFTLEIHEGRLVYVDPEHGTRSAVIPIDGGRFHLPWQWAELSTGGDGMTMKWLDFPDREWSVEPLPE